VGAGGVALGAGRDGQVGDVEAAVGGRGGDVAKAVGVVGVAVADHARESRRAAESVVAAAVGEVGDVVAAAVGGGVADVGAGDLVGGAVEAAGDGVEVGGIGAGVAGERQVVAAALAVDDDRGDLGGVDDVDEAVEVDAVRGG